MRVQFTLAFLTTAMVLSPSVSAVPMNHIAAGEVWQLDQKSCTVGAVRIYVCDKAISWSCPKIGITMVTQAPKWDVLAYNTSNKKYMQLAPEQVEKLFGGGPNAGKKLKEMKAGKDIRAEKFFELQRGSPKICGMRTFEYHVPKDSNQFGKMDSGHVDPYMQRELDAVNKKMGKVYDEKKWKQGDDDFWVAADIFLPKKIGLNMGWDTHEAHTPLRSVHIGEHGESSMSFDTIACKKVPIPKGLFDVPKGFEKTTNEMALMMGVDEEEMDILAGPDSRHRIPEMGERLDRAWHEKQVSAGSQKPAPVALQKPAPAATQKPAPAAMHKPAPAWLQELAPAEPQKTTPAAKHN